MHESIELQVQKGFSAWDLDMREPLLKSRMVALTRAVWEVINMILRSLWQWSSRRLWRYLVVEVAQRAFAPSFAVSNLCGGISGAHASSSELGRTCFSSFILLKSSFSSRTYPVRAIPFMTLST